MLVFTALTVISNVPPIVKTARVTYKAELVSRVNLGGLDYIVKQNVEKDGMVSTVVNSV